MDFLNAGGYDTFLVVCTMLTKAQLDEGKVFPSDQSYPVFEGSIW